MLWCLPAGFSVEHGGLYGRGLADLGLEGDSMIVVEAARQADTLWALEEGLRSGALSLAIGVLESVALTPSRRLGLASAASQTSSLLLTHPASVPAPAAGLRLRLGRLPSGRHDLDLRAPGPPRLGLVVERCRGGPPASEGFAVELEWCDDTYCFRMAAGLADRAHATPVARSRARD
ncbi:MAG: hypothetical protein SFW09_16395 [Hyphomicrobiaceae bacterium]|nr:hypothetical protein [Hyphomicrobiaceae bacterium]